MNRRNSQKAILYSTIYFHLVSMTRNPSFKFILNGMLLFSIIVLLAIRCTPDKNGLTNSRPKIKNGSHIVLIGNNLCSRMMNYGHFETEMHLRFPDSLLYIRNMCDGGNTPGFRPHSGRMSPWEIGRAHV